MFACFDTEVMSNFNLFLSSTCLNSKTLLGSDKELEGTMFSIVLETGSAKNLIDFLSIDIKVFFKYKFFSWTIIKHFSIPPEDSAICRC